jgi:hypothetical protein
MLTAPSGWLATQMGWVPYFMCSAVIAVPGLVLLLHFKTWFSGPAEASAGELRDARAR